MSDIDSTEEVPKVEDSDSELKSPPAAEEEKQEEEKAEENDKEEEDEEDSFEFKKPAMKTEPGMMYLSFIPPGMTPRIVVEIFKKHGEVGHVHLEQTAAQRKKQKATYERGNFKEGWVEMGDKRLARRLANSLNNTPICEGYKDKRFKSYLWSIKYLPRFRWRHLKSQLVDKMENVKKMKTVEMTQAKREATIFARQMDRSKMINSIRERKGDGWKPQKGNGVRQRKTVEEMRQAKKRSGQVEVGGKEKEAKRKKVISSIFG